MKSNIAITDFTESGLRWGCGGTSSIVTEYGDAFGKMEPILAALYPCGIRINQYGDLLAIVRILDKFFRIASHEKDPMGENPWTDVAGYGVLMSDKDIDAIKPSMEES